MSKAWMPLYIGDFLRDTMHLNCQETGAYIRLIMHAWEHHGYVPDDDIALAKIVHCHPPHWPRLRKVLDEFLDYTKTPGLGYIKRVGLELDKTEQISNKNRANALRRHKSGKDLAERSHTHSQSQSPSKEVTVTVKPSSLSTAPPARSGSNGPRAGNAAIGERIGNWEWTGSAWMQRDPDERPFGVP